MRHALHEVERARMAAAPRKICRHCLEILEGRSCRCERRMDLFLLLGTLAVLGAVIWTVMA